jgi:hypothetical protein
MRTSEVETPKHVAYVDMRRTPITHVLRGLVRREHIEQSELESFIKECGTSPSGRTEFFDGTSEDGWIEFHRTVLKVGSQVCLLHEACGLAADIETHFEKVVVNVL